MLIAAISAVSQPLDDRQAEPSQALQSGAGADRPALTVQTMPTIITRTAQAQAPKDIGPNALITTTPCPFGNFRERYQRSYVTAVNMSAAQNTMAAATTVIKALKRIFTIFIPQPTRNFRAEGRSSSMAVSSAERASSRPILHRSPIRPRRYSPTQGSSKRGAVDGTRQP